MPSARASAMQRAGKIALPVAPAAHGAFRATAAPGHGRGAAFLRDQQPDARRQVGVGGRERVAHRPGTRLCRSRPFRSMSGRQAAYGRVFGKVGDGLWGGHGDPAALRCWNGVRDCLRRPRRCGRRMDPCSVEGKNGPARALGRRRWAGQAGVRRIAFLVAWAPWCCGAGSGGNALKSVVRLVNATLGQPLPDGVSVRRRGYLGTWAMAGKRPLHGF